MLRLLGSTLAAAAFRVGGGLDHSHSFVMRGNDDPPYVGLVVKYYQIIKSSVEK